MGVTWETMRTLKRKHTRGRDTDWKAMSDDIQKMQNGQDPRDKYEKMEMPEVQESLLKIEPIIARTQKDRAWIQQNKEKWAKLLHAYARLKGRFEDIVGQEWLGIDNDPEYEYRFLFPVTIKKGEQNGANIPGARREKKETAKTTEKNRQTTEKTPWWI